MESFERKMEGVRGSSDPSLSNLLRAQVQQVVRWVEGEQDFRVYRV